MATAGTLVRELERLILMVKIRSCVKKDPQLFKMVTRIIELLDQAQMANNLKATSSATLVACSIKQADTVVAAYREDTVGSTTILSHRFLSDVFRDLGHWAIATTGDPAQAPHRSIRPGKWWLDRFLERSRDRNQLAHKMSSQHSLRCRMHVFGQRARVSQ